MKNAKMDKGKNKANTRKGEQKKMKRTRNMIYKASEEARELYLVADNEGRLYPMRQAIEANLTKKMNKGIFDADKAIEAFYYLMDAASKQYKKDFGYMFSVTERWTAAADMASDYIEEMKMQGVYNV